MSKEIVFSESKGKLGIGEPAEVLVSDEGVVTVNGKNIDIDPKVALLICIAANAAAGVHSPEMIKNLENAS